MKAIIWFVINSYIVRLGSYIITMYNLIEWTWGSEQLLQGSLFVYYFVTFIHVTFS